MYQTMGPFLWRFASELQDPHLGCMAGIFEFMYFLQIIHNQIFIPPNILHFKKPTSLRSTSCLKLVQAFVRSNHRTSHFCVLCGTASPYILCRPQHFLTLRNYLWIICTQYMYVVYRYCVDLIYSNLCIGYTIH